MSSIKTIVKVLISLLVTCICMVVVFAGGFRFFEIKFYEPRVIEHITEQLLQTDSAFDDFSRNYFETFRKYASDHSVLTYFDRDVTIEDAQAREEWSQLLFHSVPGLEGLRLLDADELHIHHTSFSSDVLQDNDEIFSYKNYNVTGELPVSRLSLPKTPSDGEGIYFDGDLNRLIFMVSVFTELDVFRGTFLFYVSGDDFVRYLINHDVVSINTRALIVEPSGFAFGVPMGNRSEFISAIKAKWDRSLFSVEPVSADGKKNLYLISTNKTLPLGMICSEDDFTFSDSERLLLCVGICVTVFLIMFIILNLKQDDSVVINSRIRKFQAALVQEYIDRRESEGWAAMVREIKKRKLDMNNEIKKSLGRLGRNHSEEIDALLDEAWSEVMGALIGAKTSSKPSSKPAVKEESKEELPSPEAVEAPAELEELDELEEVPEAEPAEEAELEELENLEEIPEAEPSEAEELDELEEIPEAEPAEPADEGELEELDELEEVPEAEPVPEAEEERFEETTLAEFMKSENPVNIDRENAEKEKREAENNFKVSPLDFSSLDNGNSN